MELALAGQVLGLAVACGLNLYLTVAALGLLSQLGIVDALPAGLQGLEGPIVITSAAILYGVETVIDKNPHVDALWDTVHTLIRPPAAALLAAAALWGRPDWMLVGGAAAALLLALATHGTKAGLRLALNATRRGGRTWISIAEDLLALTFAALAFLHPRGALIATAAVLIGILLIGPTYWRAVGLGIRCLGAWLRSLFVPARWRDEDRLPRNVRRRLEPTPLGAAPPRGTRGAITAPGVGAFRNGWLVVAGTGAAFVYRTLLGSRRLDLPVPLSVDSEAGPWADIVRIQGGEGDLYTLFLLKDGPPHDLVSSQLEPAPT